MNQREIRDQSEVEVPQVALQSELSIEQTQEGTPPVHQGESREEVARAQEEILRTFNAKDMDEVAEKIFSESESTSVPPVPKDAGNRKSSWIKNTGAAVAFALAGMGFAGASDAQEKSVSELPVATAKAEKAAVPTADELYAKASVHLKNFSKVDLANDIYKNQAEIKAVFDSQNYTSVEAHALQFAVGEGLRPVITMYLAALQQQKAAKSPEHELTRKQLSELMTKGEVAGKTAEVASRAAEATGKAASMVVGLFKK